MFAVDDPEWRKWMNQHFYVRQGISLQEMTDSQRNAAFGLLAASLSARGLKLTRDIMRLNETLAELTNDHEFLGEGRYFITVMGKPSESEPWGFQLDGHHAIINYFVLGDQVVMTPFFTGSEPVTATSGKYKGVSILQDEQNRGLDMLLALDKASLGDRAPLYKDTETRSAGVTMYKIWGAHQIKFGGEFRFDPENRAGVSPTNSSTPLSFSAGTSYTVGPLSNAAAAPIGQALASFLYGVVGGSITVPSTTDFAESDKDFSGFIQDDWKVTRKLNVNIGLRYEFQTALTERYNRSLEFVHS
jgi:outer membrane receptor protein involved in Fe transport